MLNLFYEEPDPDRWVRFDRYPRAIIRRIIRGKSRIGGQTRVFLNLCKGLDKLGVGYRVNDYSFLAKNRDAVACIIGKDHVLHRREWKNPIVLGPSIGAHPVDDPDLIRRHPVKKVLVPGQWVKDMFDPYWGDIVRVWPVGIDTSEWNELSLPIGKPLDVLVYDKIAWDREAKERELIEPIKMFLRGRGLSFNVIRYGYYHENEFKKALQSSRAMLFLCWHETQGIAYQQALSCNVPIFAWDPGGYWPDPSYFPHKVKFSPVTSVPYWSGACGMRFQQFDDFTVKWPEFWDGVNGSSYRPRSFITSNLTLEDAARRFAQEVDSVTRSNI